MDTFFTHLVPGIFFGGLLGWLASSIGSAIVGGMHDKLVRFFSAVGIGFVILTIAWFFLRKVSLRLVDVGDPASFGIALVVAGFVSYFCVISLCWTRFKAS